MLNNTFFVFILVGFLSDFSNGQRDKEFFRNDYTHIEAINSSYKIHTTKKTWFDARRQCAEEGASLFYPENEEEKNAVLSFQNKTQPDVKWIFLGISDLRSEGVFETIDGKLVSEVYNNWKLNEPNDNNGDEDCVEQDNVGKMNDCQCSTKFSFICKKSPLSLEQNNSYNKDELTKEEFDNTRIEAVTSSYKTHTTQKPWFMRDYDQERATLFQPDNEDSLFNIGNEDELFEGSLDLTFDELFGNIDNELTSSEFFWNDYTHIEAVNSSYKIHTTRKTWFEAKRQCAEEGASLFYPENEVEQNAVMSFRNRTQPQIKWVFVGISDLRSEGVFETIDGKLVSEVYNNWKVDEPNDNKGDEDCVEQDNAGKMNDCQCSTKFSFICKKSPLSLEQNNSHNKDELINEEFFRNDNTHIEAVSSSYKNHMTQKPWFMRENVTEGTTLLHPENKNSSFYVENEEGQLEEISDLTFYELFENIDDELTSSEFFWNDYTHIEAVNSSYKIHTTRKTWFEAKRQCAEEGASLFYPENEVEQNAVMSFRNRTQPQIKWVFVGISDLRSEGVFETIDGKLVSEVYNNWKVDEPNDNKGDEDCVEQDNAGKMNDCQCSTKFSFICKKSPLSLEQNNSHNKDELINEEFFRNDNTHIEAVTSSYKNHMTQKPWFMRENVTEGATLFHPENEDGSFYENEDEQLEGTTDVTFKDLFENIDVDELTSSEFFWNDYTHIEAVNSSYKIHTTRKTWFEAKRQCAEEGASLFYPENEVEQNAVMSFRNRTQPKIKWVFVGISDLRSEGVFETIDGKLVSEVYNNWKVDEPNDNKGDEDCVEQDNAGKMNDCQCSTKFSFICKKSPLSLEQNNSHNKDELINEEFFRNDNTHIEAVTSSYKNHMTQKPWFIRENVTEGATLYHPENEDSSFYENEDEQLEETTDVTFKDLFENIDDELTSSEFFWNDYTHIEAVNSSYKIHTARKTWFEAKRQCAEEGASLFYPENEVEQNAVMSFLNRTQPHIKWVFVGISDLTSEGVFETIDGKSVSEVYNNWKSDEPNDANGGEDCVEQDSTGKMNDCNCSVKFSFICKKSQPLSLKRTNSCNIDYSFNEDIGKCYKLHNTPLTWTGANVACRAEQSYLAVINNRLEADYLAKLAELTSKQRIGGNNQFFTGIYHLGFHYRFKQGWQTVIGTPFTVDDDAWWNNQQPVIDECERCGSMFYNGRLNSIDCDTKSFFICEHEEDSSTLSEEIFQWIEAK